MAKNKYYVVWKGITPGVYDNWGECKAQVDGQDGAKYKSFETKEEATKAFEKGYEHYLKTASSSKAAALVHGLALLKQKGSSLPIYSDSRNAIGWVKKKKCKTLLERVPENEPIFDMIERAEKWLKTNTYTTPILKWETSEWGEIPADFGRK